MTTPKFTPGSLRVFSGMCCLCDVGIPVNARGTWGDAVEIHTGDIVIVWHGQHIGTDVEEWTPVGGLSVVVAKHYQSYMGGRIELIEDPEPPYVMGIKDCGFDHPSWRVQVVKKFSNVISGEHWPDYGFSYAYSDLADYAISVSALSKARGES